MNDQKHNVSTEVRCYSEFPSGLYLDHSQFSESSSTHTNFNVSDIMLLRFTPFKFSIDDQALLSSYHLDWDHWWEQALPLVMLWLNVLFIFQQYLHI